MTGLVRGGCLLFHKGRRGTLGKGSWAERGFRFGTAVPLSRVLSHEAQAVADRAAVATGLGLFAAEPHRLVGRRELNVIGGQRNVDVFKKLARCNAEHAVGFDEVVSLMPGVLTVEGICEGEIAAE